MIGVPLRCGIDPALLQAKASAALALSRCAHPLRRIRSAGFAWPTGASFGCLHNNKCNMLLLLWPLPADALNVRFGSKYSLAVGGRAIVASRPKAELQHKIVDAKKRPLVTCGKLYANSPAEAQGVANGQGVIA